MSLWLKIFLAIIIWVVVTLSAVAIFQINGISTKVGPNFIGLIAVGIFLIIMRGRSQAGSGENQAPIQGLRARSTHRTHNHKDPRAFTPQDEEQTQQANTINATEGNDGWSEENKKSVTSPWKKKPAATQIDEVTPQDEEQTQQANTINATEGNDGWSEEFKILNEYDPIVKECHDELDELDPTYSKQFREEIVLDRKNATSIRDRLKAEYENEMNPYPTDLLNEGLLKAKSLGRDAEEEFICVVEVMGEDIDIVDVLQRLEEKHKKKYWE
jgi:hypothetical protein